MENIISLFWPQTSQNGAFGRGVSYKYIHLLSHPCGIPQGSEFGSFCKFAF